MRRQLILIAAGAPLVCLAAPGGAAGPLMDESAAGQFVQIPPDCTQLYGVADA